MKVPISVTLTTNGPAAAVPVFVTTNELFVSTETIRSGSGGGGGGATVQACVAGAPVLPAASVARTANVCAPTASPLYGCGLAQAAYAPPSSEQANVDPLSEAVNWKLASEPAVVAETMLVVGAVVSGGGRTVQRAVAGAPVLPARSRARTAKSCGPIARPWSVRGGAHGPYAPPSIRQAKLTSGSLARKENAAVVAAV